MSLPPIDEAIDRTLPKIPIYLREEGNAWQPPHDENLLLV
jgi:hypothetical protein